MMKRSLLGDLVLGVLAVVGLLVFVLFYDKAFPTASIDLKVSREEAQQIARGYLQARGFNVAGYDTAVTFASDELAAVYLQKKQGMEKANALMRGAVPVWFWRCRWFKPLRKQEFRIYVDPAGKVIRFARVLEEDKPSANLSPAAAANLAQAFIQGVMKVDLSGYERLEASSEKRKKRTDHRFVWKKRGFQVADGELRMLAVVQGDQVGAFAQFLKVPDQFGRSLEKETSVGQLLAMVSTGFMLILALLALAVFIAKAIARDIRWRFGIAFGAAALALSLAGFLNSIPLMKAGYRTQIAYGTFLGTAIVGVIIGSIVYGVFILLTAASGEALAREVYPESVRSVSDPIRGKVATRDFAVSALRGYALAFLLVGYMVLFYLIGRRFVGVWLPADSPSSNILNTAFPFLYPLLIGFVAAISEEFTFRLFAIPLLKKYLKMTFLALLLPAVIWAFGHSTYPVFPVYFRGIELTIAGLLFGYFFIRFGLVTCVVAHYVLDALLVALPLLRSSHPSFVVSGAAVVALGLLPVVPGLLGLAQREETARTARRVAT